MRRDHISRLNIETSLFPLILGFGIYSPLIVVLAFLFFLRFRIFNGSVKYLFSKVGFLTLASITTAFLFFYWGLNTPYHPSTHKMPWAYYPILSALCAIVILWIASLSTDYEFIKFVWLFSIGALLFCLITVGATMIIENHWSNLYGGMIDIRYLPIGIVKNINTPGIANLLCLFPATFFSGIILNKNQRPKFFWVLGITGFLLSLASALILGQRSYFAISVIVMPLIIALFLLFTKSWRSCIVIFLLIVSYPLLLKIDQLMGTSFFFRPITPHLIKDARFDMFLYWLEHILVNPFQRIEVGPAQWDHLQWFHNFFADLHRLSGFWALITAVILTSYIFLRLFYLIKIETKFGLFLIGVAIPCFLIMNTSVVPEGERQPFLLLLAIGAISEAMLANLKRTSNTRPHKTTPISA